MIEGHDAVFNPDAMFQSLGQHDVRYIVIGGIAATLQGAPFPTFDLDICVERVADNLEALARVLEDLDAKEWDPRKDIEVERTWDLATLSVDTTWILRTRLGRLDILFEPAGTTGYADLRRNQKVVELEDMYVPIAAIGDVIRMKEAANRRRDLEQLPTLRMLEQRLEGPGH